MDSELAPAGGSFSSSSQAGNEFTTSSAQRQTRRTQGGVPPDELAWNGSFLTGEKILHPEGDLTLLFDNPVAGAGFQIHHDWLNLEATHTLKAYDASDVLLAELAVNSTIAAADRGTGNAVFMGLLSDEAVIAKLWISSFAPIPPDQDRFGNFRKFALNDVLLAAPAGTPVPEPATIFLHAAGLGLVSLWRRNNVS